MYTLLTIQLVPTDYMISSSGMLVFLCQSYITAEYLHNNVILLYLTFKILISKDLPSSILFSAMKLAATNLRVL
jgi:hypothetical protein